MAAGLAGDALIAADPEARSGQFAEAAGPRVQQAERRNMARLRWAYERRRSGAHAKMPSTLYASTPSFPANGELSCPGLADGDARNTVQSHLNE